MLTPTDSDEPFYDDDGANDFYDDEPAEAGEGGENPVNEDDPDNVVISGDPSAAAAHAKGVKSLKDKKIPNEDRTTTPYLTKYEKARILGTRALQIR